METGEWRRPQTEAGGGGLVRTETATVCSRESFTTEDARRALIEGCDCWEKERGWSEYTSGRELLERNQGNYWREE